MLVPDVVVVDRLVAQRVVPAVPELLLGHDGPAALAPASDHPSLMQRPPISLRTT